MRELIAEFNPNAKVWDGLDEAIIGLDDKENCVVYSYHKILGILMERDGMTEEEAVEYYEFNIGNAYIGEFTPKTVFELPLEKKPIGVISLDSPFVSTGIILSNDLMVKVLPGDTSKSVKIYVESISGGNTVLITPTEDKKGLVAELQKKAPALTLVK